MTAARDGHAEALPMTFDQFFDSDFAKRTTIDDLAAMLRALEPAPGRVSVRCSDLADGALAWAVAIAEGRAPFQRMKGGPTLLVAACRARVAVVLGDVVPVPAELVA